MSRSAFARHFRDWARWVRGRSLARALLTGLAAGLLAGALVAALLWWFGQDAVRAWPASMGVVGGLLGLARGWRQRWRDVDVALYLDAKLGSEEVIVTACELLQRASPTGPTDDVVLRRAARVLSTATHRQAQPPLLLVWHAAAPLALAAIVALAILPMPPRPTAPASPPGSNAAAGTQLRGLERIIALEQLTARNGAERQRLDRIAGAARKLREQVAHGLPSHEALATLARLRDDITAEGTHLGDRSGRAGLAAAVRSLSEASPARPAGEALGEGSLTEFDAEMQRLANQAEREDRAAARRALEQAAAAAQAGRAQPLTEALREQQHLWGQREAGAQALRELASALRGALSEEARRDLQEFGSSGSPLVQKRLAAALAEALEQLSAEERERLAKRLRNRLHRSDAFASPMTRKQLEELARQLGSAEGRQRLAATLNDLARPLPSRLAQRQQALDDAQRGAAQAQRQLGGMAPLPVSGEVADRHSARQGSRRDPSGASQHGLEDADGEGATGSEQRAQVRQVKGKALRSKAAARLNPGGPLHGTSMGRAPARAGETANQQGSGALGNVGAEQISVVERSRVPAAYREQVGRYFQP